MDDHAAWDLVMLAADGGWGWEMIDADGSLREQLRAMGVEPGPTPADARTIVPAS